jgi:hypothetical protein
MIIDKLAARSDWVRGFCDSARVIQAPFAVFPPHESQLPVKTSLVPRDGDMISGEFAKPICDNMVVFGNGEEGREQGALFIRSADIASVPETVARWAPAGATHVLLTTVVGQTERFDCLVTYRFITFCGEHFSAPPAVALAREMSKQAFVEVNAFEPEHAGAVISLPEEDWRNFIQHQVGAMAALFALTNCRNIVRETQSPDRKLQKSRRKSGKLPLYHFATLKMKPIGRSSEAARAIHWVRGHFKEYTPDRPLFGKIAGLFWWEPHLVGATTE